jgi:hypothetical protein
MPIYTYTTLDDPLAVGATTVAQSINDRGLRWAGKMGRLTAHSRSYRRDKKLPPPRGMVSAFLR